ncbi:hypothetical protein AAE478_006861 [Parahypoxylon ruwenzoriense]
MRLLNVKNSQMTYFMSYADVPPYAILSHTWGEEEVSLKDWETMSRPDVREKEGFKKLEYCCRQAARDGLEWVWVDTCCIDKTSSAELTESINSMFRWYRDAAICYAYLTDVPEDVERSEIEKHLAKSRWFTRGWTLQELIAPLKVVFYSAAWQPVGTKSELSACISAITGIEETYLSGANLDRASVAQRMSWASRRRTSRDEDIAYCLLGIFDVNMPLIYGEGHKAFQRLQEEIMRAFPEDHTLFAWGKVVTYFSKYVESEAQVLGFEPLRLRPKEIVKKEGQDGENDDDEDDEDDGSLLGFLAKSPRDFRDSGKFVLYRESKKFFRRWDAPLTAPSLVGRTTRVDLPIVMAGPPFAVYRLDAALPILGLRRVSSAVLVCGRQDELFKFVTVPLLTCTGGYYGRTREIVVNDLISLPRVNYDILGRWRQQIVLERQPRYRPCVGDIILRRFSSFVPCATSMAVDAVDVAIDDGFVKALAPPEPGRLACLTFDYAGMVGVAGFAITISRMEGNEEHGGSGPLHFALMPVDLAADTQRYNELMLHEQLRLDEEGEEGREEAREIVEVKDDDENWVEVREEASSARSEDGGDSESDASGDGSSHEGEEEREMKDSTEEPDRAQDEEGGGGLEKQEPQFQSTREAYCYLWDHWQASPRGRAMGLPDDTWDLAGEPAARVPHVRVVARRMYVDDDPRLPVDVVDIVISAEALFGPGGSSPGR